MREDMVAQRAKIRGFWLVLALAGLFGMFTAQSTNTLKFNHVPGRICARAGGTAASMSQRERVEQVASCAVDADASLLSFFEVEAPSTPRPVRRETRQRVVFAASLWPPLLLFRPPPALSVA